MNWLRDMPIKRKVTLVILGASLVTLVLASVGLSILQWVKVRELVTRDLKAQAEIIAANSTAAVSFEDPRAANEILASLKAKPNILSAALFRPNGELFAHYESSGHPLVTPHSVPGNQMPDNPSIHSCGQCHGTSTTTAPPTPMAAGVRFQGPYLFMIQPVMLNEKRIANFFLAFDFQHKQREIFLPQLTFMGGILVAISLLAFLLSSSLQHVISFPVLELAQTARTVAEQEDYSVRAAGCGRDEIGLLTDAFNQMLSRIEDNDRTLRTVNRTLEAEIGERLRTENELRESRQRFELAVLGSSDGLWDWNLAGNEVYFSPRWKNMIGYEDEELANALPEWESRLHPEDRAATLSLVEDYLAGKAAAYQAEFRLRHKDGSYRWILARGVALPDATGKLARFAGSHTDITARKAAEAELVRLNEELVDASRQAGMAEVATGVLHNVGNVLNSANVSAELVNEQVRQFRCDQLGKIAEMFRTHSADLGAYLTNDSRGKLIPEYLGKLSAQVDGQKTRLLAELESLIKNIAHVKEIVAMQQSLGCISGSVEDLQVGPLVEDALRIHTAGFLNRGVTIRREYHDVPPVRAAKHKVMQILVNLLRNAKQAMDASANNEKVLIVSVGINGDRRVKIAVRDNGMGIAPENLPSIFRHGFTTKRNGHGFGLHSSLLAAQEMEGTITVDSEGAGKGATFTLELPLADQTNGNSKS